MNLIGKLDGMPVFEIERGMYAAVDVNDGRCVPMWSWYANLGRWNDSFEKCSSCEEELACIDLIEKNQEMLLKAFNSYSDKLQSEEGQKFLDGQDEFYNWLESDREYNWFSGYEDEQKDEE